MHDRNDNGDGIVKRSTAKLASVQHSPSGGYSTDESGDYVPPHPSSRRRGGKRSDHPPHGDNNNNKGDFIGRASVIWMVLIIGLMFCLMDAAYIARVLDRPVSIEEEGNNLAADLFLQELRERQSMRMAAARRGKEVPHRQDFSEEQKKDLHAPSKTLFRVPQRPERPPPNAAPKTFLQRLNFLDMARGTNRNNNNNNNGGGARPLTRAERLAQQKKDKEEAEVKRIRNIKLAALEALKADHGGKLPDDVIDEVLANEEAFKARPMAYYKEAAEKEDKKRILDLFVEAGLKEMDDSTFKVLPKWEDVKHLYGDEPVIVGLEQCAEFRAKGNIWEHFVSTAGTFNSGTNLMAEMLIHNCHMEARMKKFGVQNRGIRWQVPWGKHTPPGDEEYRVEHKSLKDKDVDANMILPAVTVRDPYYWMQSMCKHHYTASWRGSDRCPNLTPNAVDKANFPTLRDRDFFPLSVRYADFYRHHQSLTGLWNDWYNEYKGVEFQRLFVRYEDLLFHPVAVTKTVCECAGGTLNRGRFMYQVDSAKKGIGAHGSVRTGYVDAIIKYGSERNRYKGYSKEDLEYTRKHLDPALMEDFGYPYHPLSLESSGDEEEEEGEDAGEDGGNEHEDEPDEEGDSNREHEEEKVEPDVPEEEAEKSEDIGEIGDQEKDEEEEEEKEKEEPKDGGDKDSDEDADSDEEREQ